MNRTSKHCAEILDTCEVLLQSQCIRYRDSLMWHGSGVQMRGSNQIINQINVIIPYILTERDSKSRIKEHTQEECNAGLGMVRVSINLLRINIPKAIISKLENMPKLVSLPSMEVTMLESEAEMIGAWLALAALGAEPAEPDDLLCWPSGDYAWTIAAASREWPKHR